MRAEDLVLRLQEKQIPGTLPANISCSEVLPRVAALLLCPDKGDIAYKVAFRPDKSWNTRATTANTSKM